MRKVRLAGGVVGVVLGIPYLLAFVPVSFVALLIGKIPTRHNKLALMPVLDFLCGVLTFFCWIGMLHLVGLRGAMVLPIASVACLGFYGRGDDPSDFWTSLGAVGTGCVISWLC